MANVNRPMGLQPVQTILGAPYTGAGRVYCIPDTDDTNAYAIGDPVTLAGGADANGIATITLATAGTGNMILGVIVGTNASSYSGTYGDLSQNSLITPATKDRNYYCLVEVDPNVVYEVQEIGTGTPLTAAEVGLNANLVAGTNNGTYSGWMLDNSGEATGNTIQVKLLGLAPRIDNAFGQYAKWWVTINNSIFRPGQTGV